jgi:hypothetical protein
MSTAHITSTDPLGLASAGIINLKSITPSTPRGYVEVLLADGKYSPTALKVIRPLEQWDIVYELLDTASLVLNFGVAFNTAFLLTAASCTCGPEAYPQVTVTAIKPSSAGMIKAGTSKSLTCAGGFGIVNKWGATSALSFISSSCSISMQAIDAMHESTGDFLVDGLYRYGFKQECQAEAYAAIVAPVASHAFPNAPATPKETAEGLQVYSASWWTYLDPYAAPGP